MNQFSKTIHIHMAYQDISADQMAKCFGIAKRTWQYWLANPETSFTISRLQTLSRLLSLSDEELLRLVKQ